MIAARELRLGNYVSVKDKYIQVEDILFDGIGLLKSGSAEYQEKDLEPIPLTPELIEKCGFEMGGFYKAEDKWWHRKAAIMLSGWNGSYKVKVGEDLQVKTYNLWRIPM